MFSDFMPVNLTLPAPLPAGNEKCWTFGLSSQYALLHYWDVLSAPCRREMEAKYVIQHCVLMYKPYVNSWLNYKAH